MEGKILEIKINKNITDYQESIFFGLSVRQFICALLALIVAVVLYFTIKVIGKEAASWLCIIGAAPFAFAGFFRYNGLKLEKFIFIVLRQFLDSDRRLYQPENIYYNALRKDKKYDIW